MTDAQTFDEDRICFTFDPNAWRAIKWDDDPAFIAGVQTLTGELTDTQKNIKVPHGTKGVDFIGLHQGSLYFFEVKDFRGYAAANAYRQETELPLEIGLKVRDTIAGLIGAHHLKPTEWISQAAALLADRSRPVRVIAWIVEDAPKTSRERRVHAKTTNVRSHQLQRRLSWLTRHAWVEDPLNPSTGLSGIQAHTIRLT